MKQMVMDGEPPFLPQDIIANILKRLPVKSLIRLQCVCKQWKNLFKTPSFIADHLHHSTHHRPSLLLQQVVPWCLFSLGYEKQLHEVQNPPWIDSWSRVRIVGSSNGLLLYVGCPYSLVILSFFLWNPATRQIRHVSIKDYDSEADFYTGFGFSPIVYDYKILIAYAPRYKDEVNQVEVYSFNTPKWKEIKFQNLKGVKLYSELSLLMELCFGLGQ